MLLPGQKRKSALVLWKPFLNAKKMYSHLLMDTINETFIVVNSLPNNVH